MVSYSGRSVNLLNWLPAKFVPVHLPLFPYTKALAPVTGMKMTVGVLKEIGERGYNLERMPNIHVGLTGGDYALPKRLSEKNHVENSQRTHVPIK